MNLKKLFMLMLLIVTILSSFILISGRIHYENNNLEPEVKNQIIENITPRESFDLIQINKDNPKFVIIDIRTTDEFSGKRIENAINIDYKSDTFRDKLNKLDKNKIYLIYCRSGRRSGSALKIMNEFSFKEAYNMVGGINQWKNEGFPTIQ